MQKVQQWDLNKEKHIYSLQALKVFYSLHPISSATQIISPIAEQPIQNYLKMLS